MMKLKIFIFLIVCLNCFLFAQQGRFNKDTELQKFVERGGKIEEIGSNIIKLTYPKGNTRIYNLNHKESVVNNIDGVETTIINIWEIDTTKYADKFSFWQKVNIANGESIRVFVDDLNDNSLPELYGFSNPGSIVNIGPVEIFERNNEGIFDNIFSYDSNTVFVQGMGDVHGTGNKEIHLRTTDTLNGKFYRSDSLNPLPIDFDFIFYYYPNQIQDMTFGDFDNNGITDCIFVDGSNPSSVIICEYDKDINNFLTLYQHITEGDVPSGFAIDDFDHDSKTELVFGTGNGTIKIIENININSYEITWQNMFSTYNAYMKTATNDIDDNGKLEFWIGGQDFEQGVSRFQCYEADANNNYSTVAVIELRYLVSLYANYLQAADIDGDGKDELVISLGEYIIILKFTGKPNYHSYEIFYVKNNELTQSGNTFHPVTIYDLDGDTKKDILLPMDKYVAPNLVFMSYLLKQNKPDLVEGEHTIEASSFDIYCNYPNPFNSSTQITYSLAQDADVSIKVYDILGTEVANLVNEIKPAGQYEINFNAENLASGVYIYRTTAIKDGRVLFTSSKQMILLR